MEYRENGTRFRDYSSWEDRKYAPYDYEKNGLNKYILSNKITNTNNPVLKFILNYYEKSIVYVFKYIDILKNFKNYHWKNR